MTVLVDAPTRVDGVQLLGKAVGSGYRTPPALVRRHDGQVLQLTPLLYRVLEASDGTRTCAEIADVVGRQVGRAVTGADVRLLVELHLRPLGLVRAADGSTPEVRQANPLLRLRPRFAITDPRTTRWLTDPFRVLFRPVVATAVVLAFVVIVGWVFFERGLGPSAYDAFERPHLLLLVFVVSVLSAGFHEFGHAAAARYGGAEPGAMGAGLYLVWPAFYTDVTDSYRLGRAGRIRTDLGGLYFNAVVVVLTFVWWRTTGWEALLLLVATQVLQMVQQLLPLLRFDGYHVLADLSGVPDLYHRIRPTLAGLLPHRWRSPENRVLKPWARAVITLWVLVTVPMMLLMLVGVVMAVPRLLGTGWEVVRSDAQAVELAWRTSDLVDVAAHSLQVLGVVLPTIGCVLILTRVGHRYFRGLARWSRGSEPKRVVAAFLGAALLTLLSWAWWPHPGNYAPIQPDDKHLFTTLLQPQSAPEDHLARSAAGLPQDQAAAMAQERLASGGRPVAAFQEGSELPTRENPALAMVLLPARDDGAGAATSPDGEDPAWVFPFDKPLPPAEGDNQAIAVNTTDGSVKYDVAFALVWADGNEVLNVNEAHAYASCTDCVAVAVAFQVVLVVDHAQVIVPQNLAVAANYDCLRCITAAIASQLVLSVDGEPGQDQLRSLMAVWDELLTLAEHITSYTLSEITDQLDAFKAEIVHILATAPPLEDATAATDGAAATTGSPDGTAGPTTAPTDSPSSTGDSSAPASDGSTTPAEPGVEPAPSPTDGPAPDPTPGDSPAPAPTSEPVATESPTP